MPFHEKGSFSSKKRIFDDFLIISLFSSKNKQKTMNNVTIYFLLKNIINDVFFNVFRSINGILNKTFFYKYNICNLNEEKVGEMEKSIGGERFEN